MSRTRVIFFTILGLALATVVIGLIVFALVGRQETTASLTEGSESLDVTIVAALSVEPWVSQSANQFNEESHSLEGRPIRVDVIAMDGLSSLTRMTVIRLIRVSLAHTTMMPIMAGLPPPTPHAMSSTSGSLVSILEM